MSGQQAEWDRLMRRIPIYDQPLPIRNRPMERERLLHSITILERVRDQELPFDMEVWFDRDATPAEVEACGTAACWAGWCTRDHEFKAQGLGVDHYRYTDALSHTLEPAYNSEVGVPALADFFGLPHHLVRYIAIVDQYPTYLEDGAPVTPDQVIEHINHVLEGCVGQ